MAFKRRKKQTEKYNKSKADQQKLLVGVKDIDTPEKDELQKSIDELSHKKDMLLLEKIQPRGGITFKGDRYILTGGGYEACIRIYAYPHELTDHWMAHICNIKNTIVSVDVASQDIIEVKKNLNKSMREQNMRFRQATDFAEKYDAEKRFLEMEELYHEISSMGEALKNVVVRIFVSDVTWQALEDKIKEITALLESNSFLPTIYLNETKAEWMSMFQTYETQQKELFSQPGQSLQSTALAGGNPFHFTALEDKYGDPLGETPCGGNVIFDEFEKSSTRLAYDTVVVGNKGYGKSTYLKKRLKARAIRGDFVRTFGTAGEFKDLTHALGGVFLRLDGSDGALNPLEILSIAETQSQSYMLNLSKVSTIYRFLAGAGDVTGEDISEFENALGRLYAKFDLIPKDENGHERRITGLAPDRYPIISDMIVFLDEEIRKLESKALNDMEKPIAEKHLLSWDRIRTTLENIKQNYGDIFDRHTTIDNITDEQIVTFDISVIKDMKAEVFDAQIFSMFFFCWGNCLTNGKIMKDMWETKKKKWEDIVRFLIIVDEAHTWVNSSKPHVLDQILVAIREVRKYFAGLLLASQSIRDFVPEGSAEKNIDKLKTIFELTQYKFIFHQDANTINLMDRVFGSVLTQSQKDRINKLEMGEAILCIEGDTNIELKVELTPEEEVLFRGGA